MKILVVAAHPDDEILGIGGTIARHAEAGDSVEMLILATGSTSRDDHQGDEALAELQDHARRAAATLGALPPRFGGLPDNKMDSLALLDVIKVVEAVVAEVQPDVIYTHWPNDLNVDHGVACRAVLTAARPLPGAKTKAIYAFETLSSSEWSLYGDAKAFAPNRFVDISATLEKKLAALDCYRGEMRDFPHPRSLKAVRALAEVRGSTAGLIAAEGLMVLREVV